MMRSILWASILSLSPWVLQAQEVGNEDAAAPQTRAADSEPELQAAAGEADQGKDKPVDRQEETVGGQKGHDHSADRSKLDEDLLRALEGGAEPEETEQPPLLRIGQNMRKVQERLAKVDSGDETRDLQVRIANDLGELIERMKRGSACPQCGAANCNKHGQQARNTSGGKPKPAAGESRQGAESKKPGQGAPPQAGPPGSPRQARDRVDFIKAVWGHLPEKLREEMQQAFKESMLPGYRTRIEEYFRSIARQDEVPR